MKRLLIYEPTWQRLAREFAALPPHDLILLGEDGKLRLQGREVSAAEAAPEVSWLSAEIYFAKARQTFDDLLVAAPSLKWVQSAGAGVDLWVLPALMKRGVRVCTTHVQSVGISEYVLTGVLTHWQRERERRAFQQAREWKQLSFREVAESNWLIIGFGAIGQDVAKRAKAFGANIVGVRRNQAIHPLADRIIPLSQIKDELPNADVVVLAVPAEGNLVNLVDADFLARMKAGSVLVNVGRGGLIVDADLLAALDKGIPDHAVLDTFEPEPLPPEHPYWLHPRVALSPHASAYGNGLRKRADAHFFENARRYLVGEPLIHEYVA